MHKRRGLGTLTQVPGGPSDRLLPSTCCPSSDNAIAQGLTPLGPKQPLPLHEPLI